MGSLLKGLLRLPARCLIALARVYQLGVSPLLPPMCRFTPTCSSYFIQAVEKYGAIRGGIKGLWRICRCHPFRPGGFDPP